MKCLRDLVTLRNAWIVTKETNRLNTVNFANYKISSLSDNSCIRIWYIMYKTKRPLNFTAEDFQMEYLLSLQDNDT